MILRDIVERRAPLVLEFGSGKSTIAIAAALQSTGGSVVTIEHDRVFAEGVAKRLERHGLLERAEIRIVPLREYGQRHGLPRFQSYDLGGQEIDFDVAVIDGPIITFGAATRAVPLEWCVARTQRGPSTWTMRHDRVSRR